MEKKEILQTLAELPDFFEAYRTDLLIPRIITQASKRRDAYEDLQVVKCKEKNFYGNIIDYLEQCKEGIGNRRTEGKVVDHRLDCFLSGLQ